MDPILILHRVLCLAYGERRIKTSVRAARGVKRRNFPLTQLILFSFLFQAMGANPYETNIVSWGSMRMLDQPVVAIAAGFKHTAVLVKKRVKSGCLEKAHDPVSQRVALCAVAGHLFFSPPLPQGTAVAIFDINGRMLYKTIARGASIRLPRMTANRVALWRISHPAIAGSGKIVVR
jgi:hypothetical protein